MSESRCTWCGMLSEGDHAPNCPVGEAKKLRTRNAELEWQLAEANDECSVWKREAEKFADMARKSRERAEQAEQRIAESRRQEPVAYYVLRDGIEEPLYFRYFCSARRYAKDEDILPLYACPVVPPTVEEAVKAEREACADIASNHECGGEDDIICQGQNCGTCIAGSIRARSGK